MVCIGIYVCCIYIYIQGECTSKINYAFYNVLLVLCFDVIFYFPPELFIYYIILGDYRVYARAIVHTHTHTIYT